MTFKNMSFVAAALVALAGPALADGKPGMLVKEKEIPLEGQGGWDYVMADGSAQRAYVAHGAKIDVVDYAKGEKIGSVEGVDGAHGTVIAAKKGFATAGRKNKLEVFDLETFKVSKEIDTGEGCDGILFVSSANEVWTFNGKAKSITCVDPEKLEVKATIALEGRPEAAVEDAAKGLVYLDLEDKNSICVLDIKSHKVAGTHPIEGADGPSGLAIDAKNGLIFAGCGDKKMYVMETTSWKLVATLDIGEHCDGCAFDPDSLTAYASCRTGTSAIHEKDAKTFDTLPALDGGKTCTFDAKNHKLFVTSGPKKGEQGSVKVTVFGIPKA